MIFIAVGINSHWKDSAVVQPQTIPAFHAPTPQPVPQPAAPVEPKYPIHKLIPVNQDGWTDELSFKDDERVEWRTVEDNIWLDNRVNRINEFRGFPRNDTRSRVIPLHETMRTLQCRVTPGTPVKSGTVEITIRKQVPVDFNSVEKTLLPAVPTITATGGNVAARWPSEMVPTRFGKLPPDGYIPGTRLEAFDTMYPIEDVLYRILPGWNVTPFTDGGGDVFQAASDPEGVRIRPTDPDRPITIKFKLTKVESQAADTPNTGQRRPSSQGGLILPPNGGVPAVRPVYPSSPTGPSYYPRHKPN